jgi:hypothetical protein
MTVAVADVPQPKRCSWLEPGRSAHRCGAPGVVESPYGDVRCRRHAPRQPWIRRDWRTLP